MARGSFMALLLPYVTILDGIFPKLIFPLGGFDRNLNAPRSSKGMRRDCQAGKEAGQKEKTGNFFHYPHIVIGVI